MSTTILIEPTLDGYQVTVSGPSGEAREWFAHWKAARHAADTIQEQLTEAGVDVVVNESPWTAA